MLLWISRQRIIGNYVYDLDCTFFSGLFLYVRYCTIRPPLEVGGRGRKFLIYTGPEGKPGGASRFPLSLKTDGVFNTKLSQKKTKGTLSSVVTDGVVDTPQSYPKKKTLHNY